MEFELNSTGRTYLFRKGCSED